MKTMVENHRKFRADMKASLDARKRDNPEQLEIDSDIARVVEGLAKEIDEISTHIELRNKQYEAFLQEAENLGVATVKIMKLGSLRGEQIDIPTQQFPSV